MTLTAYSDAAVGNLTSGWKVELQVGDTLALVPGLYDSALYDTDVYGSADPTAYLIDVTSRCMGLTVDRGRRKYTGRFKTGSCSLLLDNNDGAFTGGTPPIGVLSLRPGRTIRITYEDSYVFTGFVDTMSDVHGGDGSVNLAVQGYDAFSSYNVNDRPAVAPVGGGELAFERVVRLLEHYVDDFTLSRRALSPWVTTVQATAMGQNLLSELQITADSEGGGCWVGPTGGIVFTQRDYFTDRAELPPDWVVGAASPIQIGSVVTQRTMQRIVSEAHMARTDGDEQIAINGAAVGLFGRRTHTRLDLINDEDSSVAELAQRLVDFAGVDRLRLTELSFLPAPLTDTAAFCSRARFGDVILATVNTLQGWATTTPTQLFGIRHDVTADTWVCTMFVDDSVFAPTTAAFDQNAFDTGFS